MPRKRDIKYSFFENEELGADGADPLYSLLFVGLWCLADREGRLEDRPLKIKGKLFPYRTINNPDAMLQWLADHGFIERYEVDGKRYIQVLNFAVHQNPHPNEAASIIPKNVKTLSKNEKSRVTREMQHRAHALPSYSSFPSCTSCSPASQAADAAAEKDPVARRIWKDGIDVLVQNGMTEANARPLLGRLAKQYSEALLAESIAVTQAKNPADPKAFLIGVLKERSTPKPSMLVGKSTEEYIEPDCKSCNDTGRKFIPKEGAEFSWEMEDIPCPDCDSTRGNLEQNHT